MTRKNKQSLTPYSLCSVGDKQSLFFGNPKNRPPLTLKSIVKFLFGIPLTIISFYFIFLILFNSKNEVITMALNVRIFPLLAGIVLLIIFFILRSLIWRQILEKQGYSLPVKKALFLLSKSELRRYIPGNIVALATRVTIFKEEKIPARVVIKSLGIEALLFIFSSVIVSIPGIIFLLQITSSSIIFSFIPIETIVVGVLLTIILVFTGIYYLLRKFRLTRKKIIGFFNDYKQAYALSVFSWFFFGIGNLLVASSLIYLEGYKFVPITSFFVLSWLVGYLSFVTPMGLGVREAFVIFILSHFISIPIAASVAIFLRVALICSELVAVVLSYTIYRMKKIILSPHTLILYFSIASYVSYFSYVTFQKHNNFFTGRFDLGNMDQTVWNTLHGRIFTLTNPDGINIVSRLGIHADFFLILLVPFYVLWADPRMLLFIQSAVLGLGVFFVYALATNVIKNKNISIAFSLSYLLNPFVEKQNLYDFHSVTLATTFLLATFFFLYIKRYKLFILFLILSVLTKENIFLISALLGLYLFLKDKKIAGTALLIVSLTSFYTLVAKIIPTIRGGEHFAISYFQEFGDSPGTIIKNLIIHPDKFIPFFVSMRSFSYVFSLLIPVGFIALLSPFYILFVFPDLFINIASRNANFTNMTFHYGAAIIPFIYISAIFGAKKLLSKKHKLITPQNLFYYVLFFACTSAWVYGPLPGSNHPSIEMFTNTIKEGPEISGFISKIPQSFSVAASNNLGAHLSHREKIYTIPSQMKNADMVLFLLNDQYAQPSIIDQKRFVVDLENNGNYTEVFKIGDFYAFKRK